MAHQLCLLVRSGNWPAVLVRLRELGLEPKVTGDRALEGKLVISVRLPHRENENGRADSAYHVLEAEMKGFEVESFAPQNVFLVCPPEVMPSGVGECPTCGEVHQVYGPFNVGGEEKFLMGDHFYKTGPCGGLFQQPKHGTVVVQ